MAQIAQIFQVIIEMTVIYINLKLKNYVKKSNTYLSGAGEH